MMKKEKKRRRLFVTKIVLIILAVCLCAAVGFCSAVIIKTPQINSFDAEPKGYRSSILDHEGTVIQTLSKGDSNRVYVTLSDMPEPLKQAFVAIEDERFYSHHGVDVKGLARAAVRGVVRRGFSEGASTITQQLIKNNVLTEWTTETTFYDKVKRKIREQYLALQLERSAGKDWILENYLNTINLGSGTWGVEAASYGYFNKSVSNLTLSEAAVLAAIPKSPTEYDPIRNPEDNKARRKLVLDKMLSLGSISQKEYDEAMADPVYERIAEVSKTAKEQKVLSWFEDALVLQVVEDLEQERGMTSDAAWDLLYSGGLTIESTADARLQKICEKVALSKKYGGDAQGSIMVIDVHTGQVRALTGGRGEKEASLVMNRATESIRQPGSTIKVIGEYAAGLEEEEITLGTTFDDAPYKYSNGTKIHNVNKKYQGMTTVRSAIADSNNIVAVKCLQKVGIDETFSQIEEFGISTLDDNDKVEALALGGTANGVTNLELTAAYGAIARGGTYIEPVLYTRVLAQDGSVLLETEPDEYPAVSTQTAALLTDAMKDVMTKGTGVEANVEGVSLAGKSGTTTSGKDVWFVGYSSELVCGVWGGYDDNKEQEDTTYIKKIWRGVMKRAQKVCPGGELKGAEGMASVKICTKCGLLAEEGLCDQTVAGDMTAMEYYAYGTEPTQTCTCHIKIADVPEGFFQLQVGYKVYLRSASKKTEDVQYVMPEGGQEYTDVWYNNWVEKYRQWKEQQEAAQNEGQDDGNGDGAPGDGETPGDGGNPDGGGNGDGNTWWDSLHENSGDGNGEGGEEPASGQSLWDAWW